MGKSIHGSLIIIFVLCAHIAASFPATPLPPTNTTNPSNLECITSPDWVTPSFRPLDCYSAIEIYTSEEVRPHGDTIYEFLATEIGPINRQYTQSTPRKYVYQSCTMVIVMLVDLAAMPIPGASYPRNDLSSFLFIENAAKNVRDGCLGGVLANRTAEVGFVNPAGYDVAGTVFRSYSTPLSHIGEMVVAQNASYSH